MVVSEGTRDGPGEIKCRNGSPDTPEVQGTSKSSYANPCLVGQHPAELEAYITVVPLKNFTSTMANTIMHKYPSK